MDAIAAIGARECVDSRVQGWNGCAWAMEFRELRWLSFEMSRKGRAPGFFWGDLCVSKSTTATFQEQGIL